MENSYCFFENRECKYYPCHEGAKHLNCLFCYCPLYGMENCPGNYKMIDINGKATKECMDCLFPHKAENYEIIMALLAAGGAGSENREENG